MELFILNEYGQFAASGVTLSFYDKNNPGVHGNFEGRKEYGPDGRRVFNEEGNQYFNIRIDNEEDANTLYGLGYRVKEVPANDRRDKYYLLKIRVNFDSFRPPYILMSSYSGDTVLDRHTCGILDRADIEDVKITVNPSRVDENGMRTAYLGEFLCRKREGFWQSRNRASSSQEPLYDVNSNDNDIQF